MIMRYLSILIMALVMVLPSFGATTYPASTNGNNIFFGTNSFVKPIQGDGSLLTNLNAGSISSGTLADSSLSTNVFYGDPTSDEYCLRTHGVSSVLNNFYTLRIVNQPNISSTGLDKWSAAILGETQFPAQSNNYTATHRGVYGYAHSQNLGSINTLSSFYGFAANNSGGYVQNLTGLYFQGQNNGTGSVANVYGIYVANPINGGGGSMTNVYGVFVEPITTGTNKYCFFTSGSAPASFGSANITTSGTMSGDVVKAVGTSGFELANLSLLRSQLQGVVSVGGKDGVTSGWLILGAYPLNTALTTNYVALRSITNNGNPTLIVCGGTNMGKVADVSISGSITATNGIYHQIMQTNSGLYTNVWQPRHSFGALSMYTTNTINGGANTYAPITNYTTANSNLMGCSLTGGIISPSISGFYRVGIHLSGVAVDNSARVEGDLLLNGVEKDEVSFVTTFDNPPRLKGMSAIGIIYITNNTPITFQVKSSGAGGIEIVRAQMTVGSP